MSSTAERSAARQQRHLPFALGRGGLARGLNLLLGLRLTGAGGLRFALRFRLFNALCGQGHRTVDLGNLGRELGLDLPAVQVAITLNFGETHFALSSNPRGLPATFRCRLLFGYVGQARGPRSLDFALPDNRRLFLFAGKQQSLLGRIELTLSYRHLGVRLDGGPLLLVGRDDLGEAAHAERVESVVLIQRVKRGLVQPGKRYRLEQKAVLGQVFSQHRAHIGGVLRARVLEALHRVTRRHRERCVDELSLQDFPRESETLKVLPARACAAVATPSSVAATRTWNSAPTSTRNRSRVITERGPMRSTSSLEVRMLISTTSCRKGSAMQPPSSTTRCPPRPVRTRALSRVALR